MTENAVGTFLLYTPEVETIDPNEQQVIRELAETMRRISAKVGDQFRHTMRPVHAKSHGLLRGSMTVFSELPPAYKQGLFAEPATYDALVRLSTNPGDILPDSVSSPRGWAIKLIGTPEGAGMLPDHEGECTQDFLCVDGPAFNAPDAAGFLKQIQLFEKHATDSAELKQVISTTARFAEAAVEAVGGESATLRGVGHPETHILGETFYTQTPLRYGNYVAKVSFAPRSENLRALTNKQLDHTGNYSSLRDAVREFFETERAEWEVRVQLAVSLEQTPVEDASVVWPEDAAPFMPVGILTVEPQETYSAARRVFVDEHLSFSPWHGLLAHQPLGNVNRARKMAYPKAANFRRDQEGRTRIEPKRGSEIPD